MKKYMKLLLVLDVIILLGATGCMASHYGHSTGGEHSSGCH